MQMNSYSVPSSIGQLPVILPTTQEELLHTRSVLGAGATFVAGGTLLRTQWEGGTVPVPSNLIALDTLEQLHGISEQGDGLRIGAMTRLRDCISNPAVVACAPLLSESVRYIAAPSIRNIATLGGNIVSTVGDALPALLVMNAELEWLGGEPFIRQSLREWLDSARSNGINREAVLCAVHIPRMVGPRVSFFRKVGRRTAFTPALVSVAFEGVQDAAGKWISVAMSAGGGACIPARLPRSEELLLSMQPWRTDWGELAQMVQEDFAANTDAFATAEYRSSLAGNLLAAGLFESMGCTHGVKE